MQAQPAAQHSVVHWSWSFIMPCLCFTVGLDVHVCACGSSATGGSHGPRRLGGWKAATSSCNIAAGDLAQLQNAEWQARGAGRLSRTLAKQAAMPGHI